MSPAGTAEHPSIAGPSSAYYRLELQALYPGSAGRRRPELGLTVVLAKKVP
jgi:hypothetical protein